jgi:hypothetical protein
MEFAEFGNAFFNLGIFQLIRNHGYTVADCLNCAGTKFVKIDGMIQTVL